MLYADLAIPISVDRLFTYLVPDKLQQSVQCGARVLAPFGGRTVVGIIVKLSSKPPDFTSSPEPGRPDARRTISKLKPIRDLLDPEPIITQELLSLSGWMAQYYCAPLGKILQSVLILTPARAGKRFVELIGADTGSMLRELSSSPSQAAIIKTLSDRGKTSVSRLRTILGIKSIYPALSALTSRGFVQVQEEVRAAVFGPKFEAMIKVDDARKAEWARWLANAPSSVPRQQSVIRELLSNGDGRSIPALEVLRKTRATMSTLRTLEEKGILSLDTREIRRTSIDADADSSSPARKIILNPHQQQALDAITSGIDKGEFRSYLLFGVTGSGKTQVYIEAIRRVLARGKSAIVLVPEISLTPQIVRRFKVHFGDLVVAQHSRMSRGERADAWRCAREGRASVVIGPRSAVFAPLRNLGLIVVDEEQEPSYKQYDQSPQYHARDVAVMRANYSKAVVVLGSATPSFESYSNAVSGKYVLLELPERVDNARLPQIKIVDMAEERKTKLAVFRADRKADFKSDPVRARAEPRKFHMSSLSGILIDKIGDRLRKKEGIIILQNRRGFSPFIECYECGAVEGCPNCSISLTYHATHRELRCHYCGLVKPAPDVCPKCASPDIQYRGFGTQRVEEELRELFPGVALVRMDRDTTMRRNSHEQILKKFSDGEADILLGTQMVAKGLDISRVTLVGVISADTQMLLPDFRSSEHTFQLLAQVAGRAGRSTLPGEVVIQTYLPGHPTLKHIESHDFKAFYENEIGFRRSLAYPPFSRLLLIEFRGKSETDVLRNAAAVAETLRRNHSHMITLGPATAAISRLKGLFRCHILLKDLKRHDSSARPIQRAVEEVLLNYSESKAGGLKSVSVTVDVDPIGMM
jgi:primosomal protein N' (replication factor Y)